MRRSAFVDMLGAVSDTRSAMPPVSCTSPLRASERRNSSASALGSGRFDIRHLPMAEPAGAHCCPSSRRVAQRSVLWVALASVVGLGLDAAYLVQMLSGT